MPRTKNTPAGLKAYAITRDPTTNTAATDAGKENLRNADVDKDGFIDRFIDELGDNV